MERAHAEVDAALAAGRTPIVVGGTGLYLRAALAQLDLAPPPPPELRARLEAREPAALHAELAARAPELAAEIDPGDGKRLVRTLELLEMGETPPRPGDDSQLWTADTRHPTLLVGLTMERERAVRRHRRTRGRDGGRWRRGGGAPGRGGRRSRAPPATRSASTSCWPATWRA